MSDMNSEGYHKKSKIDDKRLERYQKEIAFDLEKFTTKLTDRRDELKKLYIAHKHESVNPYEQFMCCESLQIMGDIFNVERRTVGNWESGASIPNIAQDYGLAKLLDCKLEYLLGLKEVTEPTQEVEDYSGAGIIQRISYINPEIIYYAKYDPYYRFVLNEIMDPNNCLELIGLVRNVSALTTFKKIDIDEIKDPLKALVILAFNNYTIRHSINEGTIENYKKELCKILKKEELNLSTRQKKTGIYVRAYISKKIRKEFDYSSYDGFIDTLATYTYEPLSRMQLSKMYKAQIVDKFSQFIDSLIENYSGVIEEL